MAILVVTGTGTEIGKTVATAAVAAASLRAGAERGRAETRPDRAWRRASAGTPPRWHGSPER